MRRSTERRALQIAVALAGCVPVGGGLAGMLLGADLAGARTDPALDSHVRYLSGLLFAIGIAFWTAIPRIETHGPRFRLLGALVVIGGLARLVAMLALSWPGAPMAAALIMELVVTPALVVWQARVARLMAR